MSKENKIADDRKESCFHIMANERRVDCIHSFSSAGTSNVHARCARGKIANNMADDEGKFCCNDIASFKTDGNIGFGVEKYS